MNKLISLAVTLCALLLPVQGQAENWPERTVRLIVPYPAGGNADVVGRLVAHALQEKLHQPFVVENKAGAGGIIGAMSVIHASADGYTLLFCANGPILFAPELVKQRPYEWDKAFAPISIVSLTPLVVVLNPKSPDHNFKDFLAHAKKDGAKLTFAAGGIGTINHLFSEFMQERLNLKWTTVQYRGTHPAMADLIADHVGFSIDQVSSAAPFIKQNLVRAIAVTGANRSPVLPDVPTLKELGYPNLIGNTFTAMMAPAGTPKSTVAKIYANLVEVLKDPEVRDKIQKLGADTEIMTQPAFEAYLRHESATWIPIVRKIPKK